MQNRGILTPLKVISCREKFDVWLLSMSEDEKNVISVVNDSLKSGAISIPGSDGKQFPAVRSVTQYLNTFGIMIAERIKNQFQPLFDPATERLSPEILAVNEYIQRTAGYSLYDAQLAVCEAHKRCLERKKATLCIAECGSGKTKIGLTALHAYNSNRRTSKRKIRERQLPGVSPLVYSRFLMDSAAFLSLNDMGKDLPEYEEIPVQLQMNEDVAHEYHRIEEQFKCILRYQKDISKKVLSAYLGLLTVYPDQPYDQKPVVHPITGEDLIVPKDTQADADLKVLYAEHGRLNTALKNAVPGYKCPVCASEVTEENAPVVQGDLRQRLSALIHEGKAAKLHLAGLHSQDSTARDMFDQGI